VNDRIAARIGCVLAVAVALTLAIQGKYGPASVLAALAAFLIYWSGRLDGGER
jgi:hypothetical protein